MKGISTTLIIVVTAIVILVAALVVLSIFGQGITPITDITQARNICQQQVAVTCQAIGQVPPTWHQNTMRQGDIMVSCSELVDNCRDCTTCVSQDFVGPRQ